MSATIYDWNNAAGGAWGTAANWVVDATGLVSTVVPGAANAVNIAGDSGFDYLTLTGTGAAASVDASGNILLLGTVNAGTSFYLESSGDFELDGGAKLTASTASLGSGSIFTATDAATVAISGISYAANTEINAAGGSTMQFGGLVADTGALEGGGGAVSSLTQIGVDGSSSVEIGATGGAAAGAITVDSGQTLTLNGSLFGNVVLTGSLTLTAGSTVHIDASGGETYQGYIFNEAYYDPFGAATGVSGAGTINISEGSSLLLGVADSAALKFTGPNGKLFLSAVPTGTISGFANGDLIGFSTGGALTVTNISYSQTTASAGKLTLKDGSAVVGTLNLSGSYSAAGFHYVVTSSLGSYITYQLPSAAPTTITGTAGSDVLYATANGQTLTGGGADGGNGADVLAGRTYTGLVFKDTSANLNGASITGYSISDTIDLTDFSSAGATVSYGDGYLSISNATTSDEIAVSVPAGVTFPDGVFNVASDGASGSDITFTDYDLTATANNQTLTAVGPGGKLNGTGYNGIAFTGTVATLGADSIIGFNTTDSLDLTNLAYASTATATYVNDDGFFGYNYTLTLTSGSTVISIPFGADPLGDGFVKLASDGAAGTKITFVPTDVYATAKGQTLTAVAGAYGVLAGGTYIGLTFAGATSAINGDLITGYDIPTDKIDLTNLAFATATVTSLGQTTLSSVGNPFGISVQKVVVSDGTNSATIYLTGNSNSNFFGGDGYFALSADGGGGTDLTYFLTDVTATANNQTLTAVGPGGKLNGTGYNGIAFTGTVATLGADSIIGYNVTDSLDLTNLAYASTATASYTGSYGNVGGFYGYYYTLTITDGSTVVSMPFGADPLEDGFFKLASDGASGTKITFVPTDVTATANGQTLTAIAGAYGVLAGGTYTGLTFAGTTTAIAGDEITGFDVATDKIDLTNLAFATAKVSNLVHYNNSNELQVTISDGTNSATIYAYGDSSSNLSSDGFFALTSDGKSGTYLTYVDTDVYATAKGQTLTAVAGGFGELFGGTYIGLTFAGATTAISGDNILGFDIPTDKIDLTNLAFATAEVTNLYNYGSDVYVSVTDGTNSASFYVYANSSSSFSGDGIFSLTSDGKGGTDLTYLHTDVTATASNQTITAIGTGGLLAGGTYTGLTFTGTSAQIGGDTVSGFDTATDKIGVTDLNAANATVSYYNSYTYINNTYTAVDVVTVTDGVKTASIDVAANATGFTSPGYWAVGAGTTGVVLSYVTLANTDSYVWNNPIGGTLSTAANWTDSTTSAAATAALSVGNNLTINGTTLGYTNVNGTSAGESLTTTGLVGLYGALTLSSAYSSSGGGLKVSSGTLALDGGASLTASNYSYIYGTLQVGGGSTLKVTESTTYLENSTSVLSAIGGSTVQLAGLNANGTVIVDAKSSIEAGTAGGAAKGALTIDAGQSVSDNGTLDGNLVVNGTLAAGNATITGNVSGTGTLQVSGQNYEYYNGVYGYYGFLTLNGADSAAIQFVSTSSNESGILTLNGALPTGQISGFTTGDSIVINKDVTSLAYASTGTGTGTLTLYNGTTSLGSLKLAGTYTASDFLLFPSSGGINNVYPTTTTITYTPSPSTTTGSATAVTTDSYSWAAASGGNWDNAANWSDASVTGTLTTAPGATNNATFNSEGAGYYQVTGNGSVAALTINGSVDFTGSITAASVTNYGAYLLSGGASLTTGAYRNNNNGAHLTGGSKLISTGSATSYTYTGDVTVSGGSTAQFAQNAADSYVYGDDGSLTADATSSIEIGSTGGAAKGAVTVDTGATLAYVGAIDANLVLNGTFNTYDATNYITGAVTGSGSIVIGNGDYYSNAILILDGADSAGLTFNSSYYGNTLVLAGALPTGTISNFALNDKIVFDKTVTALSYTQTTSTTGTLTLLNGATSVGTLTLAGTYTADQFELSTAAATGVSTLTYINSPAVGTASTASTGTDAYSWNNTPGSWGTASNWTDTTTSTTPTTAPGAKNAVTINTGSGTAQITGSGAAASVSLLGQALFSAATVTTAGALSVSPSGSYAGGLSLTYGSKLTAGSAALAGNTTLSGASKLAVTNGLSVSGATLELFGGSSVSAKTFTATAGSVIAVDSNSLLLVGGGSSGYGWFTVNTAVALAASIYGNVTDNGTIAVTGGNTLLIDMNAAGTGWQDPYAAGTVNGTGSFSITEGGTLGLGVATADAINFAGPSGTLLLAALPTSTISGFTYGDAITIDKTITGVKFAQTTTTAGTLTLLNGSTTVGTLKLAGSYTGDNFHVDINSTDTAATVSLQDIGLSPAQPTLITGSVGADSLNATASGQTLTGDGGGDIINGGAFGSLTFKDTTADFLGASIQNFQTTDKIDLTDLASGSASFTYTNGLLTVTDGTHKASFYTNFNATPASGSFHLATDGSTGSLLTWS